MDSLFSGLDRQDRYHSHRCRLALGLDCSVGVRLLQGKNMDYVPVPISEQLPPPYSNYNLLASRSFLGDHHPMFAKVQLHASCSATHPKGLAYWFSYHHPGIPHCQSRLCSCSPGPMPSSSTPSPKSSSPSKPSSAAHGFASSSSSFSSSPHAPGGSGTGASAS